MSPATIDPSDSPPFTTAVPGNAGLRDVHITLSAAHRCADDLGEDRVDLGTVFGPTNVAIHDVAVPMELGSARTAVRNADEVRLDRLPAWLGERHSRYLIDLARAHQAVDQPTDAVNALVEAEQFAPEELRHHRHTHTVLTKLRHQSRRSTQLDGLIERCQLAS